MAIRPQPQPQPIPVDSNGKPPMLVPIYPTQLYEQEGGELNLRQLLLVVQRRKVIIGSVAMAVTAATWLWTLSQTPQYEGRFQLLVEPVTAEQNLQELTKIAGANNAPGQGLDYNTQIQVLRSPELMTPIAQSLQSRYPGLGYGALLQNLTVMRLQETKILEVRYRGTDPAQIKEVLDELSESYLRYSLQERQTNLRQGIQFVNAQLETLRKRVDRSQEDLQKFRQRYNFIEPEILSQQLSQQSSTLTQQRLEIDKQLAEAQKLYASLQEREGAASALSEAPQYQKLMERLRDIETKSAIEASRFSAQNPTMQTLQDQRENLVPLLRQEARRVLGDRLATVATQIQILEVRSQAIAEADSVLSQQLNQFPVLSRQYTDLQRELKVATESLNRFLATRETLQIDAAQKEVPWQLISEPTQPQTPISPNLQRNFLLGAIGGILLGLVAALLAERLDNTFHSADELREATRLPLLGVIPYNRELTDEPAPRFQIPMMQAMQTTAQVYMTSGFREAFRSLHANVRLLTSDTSVRSLVISSALPGDGKSTVALNLAQAASAMGQRVLLVDADLRRPQVSRILALPNLRGLSNLISSELDARQVIQRLPDDHPYAAPGSNLYVLTSGQIPPDPTKLLSSKKMKYLIEQFQAVFDLVIYDTPPLVGLADSSLLASETDGIVVIVGLGRTDRTALTEALDRLKISQTPILGMVANGVKSQATKSYSHYYHKYYGQPATVVQTEQSIQ